MTTAVPGAESSRFLSLPTELRLICYEFFLDEITLANKKCTLSTRPRRQYDFLSYIALIRTSKAIHAEVTPLFHDTYLRRITWHFDSEFDLYMFDQMRQRTNLKDMKLHFDLRLRFFRPKRTCLDPHEELEVTRSQEVFIARQMKQGRWNIPSPRLWRALSFAMVNLTYPEGSSTWRYERYQIHSHRVGDLVHLRINFVHQNSHNLQVRLQACLKDRGSHLWWCDSPVVSTVAGDLDAVDWTGYDIDLAKSNSTKMRNDEQTECKHNIPDWD